MTATELADNIAQLGLEKKGDQICTLDVRGLSHVTDYFVIMSADSDVQLRAIADNIEKKLREEHKLSIYHREGQDSSNWILLDYIDVVVHLFRKEAREYYGLERLWADAKFKWITEEKVNEQ